MAIAFTNKAQGSATGDGPYSTVSWAPSNGRLYLLAVHARTNITADTVQPGVTGNGMAWVLVADVIYDTTSTSRKRLSVFRAMVASGATTGATTITYSGQAQTAAAWTIDEVTGMDTSGTNGSGAIVQSNTNKDETLTATALTVTLSSGIGTGNATWGAFANDWTNVTWTTNAPGSGYTESGFADEGTYLVNSSEYKLAGSTAVNYTWGTDGQGGAFGGVGVEIKIAPATAAVTGTATASITESDVVTGGKTLVITLSGDTFIAS